jgi:hypothetical protein
MGDKMSEQQSKYVNAYIDTAVGTIHEYLSVNLQLKTQLKVTSDVAKEKDDVIASLRQELESIRKSDFEYSKAKDDARRWEDQFNGMKNKVSHMDNLMTQMADMKRIIQEKDSIIENLNKTLAQKEEEISGSQTTIINRKKQQKTKTALLPIEKEEAPEQETEKVPETNDF